MGSELMREIVSRLLFRAGSDLHFSIPVESLRILWLPSDCRRAPEPIGPARKSPWGVPEPASSCQQTARWLGLGGSFRSALCHIVHALELEGREAARAHKLNLRSSLHHSCS